MDNSHTIEQTLDSREVSEMVGKQHKDLMRDIKRYIGQMNVSNEGLGGERKTAPTDFFRESTYITEQNKQLPCYQITKKGCEFIAHKLTGVKGTAFTARYINRFHEMKEILLGHAAVSGQKAGEESPWFIKKMDGRCIMLFRDFECITGIKLLGNYTGIKRQESLIGGIDYNVWYEDCTNEKCCREFKEKYGFDYGPENNIAYLYPCGIIKAFQLIQQDGNNNLLTTEAAETLKRAVDYITERTAAKTQKDTEKIMPAIHINITIDRNKFIVS